MEGAIFVLHKYDSLISNMFTYYVGRCKAEEYKQIFGNFNVDLFCYRAEFNVEAIIQVSAKAIYSSILMFIGTSDNTVLLTNIVNEFGWFETSFIIAHILSFLSTVLIVLSAFGQKILQKLGLLFSINDKVIIFGITQESIEFAKSVQERQGKRDIIFVGNTGMDKISKIESVGAYHIDLIINEKSDVDISVLKLICMINRTMFDKKLRQVFFMYEDDTLSLDLMTRIVDLLKKENIKYGDIEFYLNLDDKLITEELLGRLRDLDTGLKLFPLLRNDIIAEILFEKINADMILEQEKRGNAFFFSGLSLDKDISDKKILLLGAGYLGQVILKNTAIYEQAGIIDEEGKITTPPVRVHIIDKNATKSSNQFYAACPGYRLNKHHLDAEFRDLDVYSDEFTAFLEDEISNYRYIIIALGNDSINIEICRRVEKILKLKDIETRIYVRIENSSLANVVASENIKSFASRHEIVDYGRLISKELWDRAEYLNNEIYNKTNTSEVWNWDSTTYFENKSNWSSVRFWDMRLRLLVPDIKAVRLDVKCGLSKFAPPLLEVLGQIEHSRWIAYHLSNGWQPGALGLSIDLSEVETKRISMWPAEKVFVNTKEVRKNREKELHVALVPWDDLEHIDSELVNFYDKHNLEYEKAPDNKEYDRLIVLQYIKELLAKDNMNSDNKELSDFLQKSSVTYAGEEWTPDKDTSKYWKEKGLE